VHNFESAKGTLPPAVNMRITQPTNPAHGGADGHFTWFAHVLPYLEQAEALARFDLKTRFNVAPNLESVIAQIHVPGFFCPSRRSGRNVMRATSWTGLPALGVAGGTTSDYAAVGLGDDVRVPLPDGTIISGSNRVETLSPALNPHENNVLMSIEGRTRFKDIRDGLSNTAMIGEKHVWQPCLNVGVGSADVTCADGSVFGMRFYAQLHSMRYLEFPLTRGGSDSVAPHSPSAGAQFNAATDSWSLAGQGVHWASFGSWHPGVCQFVFADGSVRSLRNNTSLNLLWRLGDRRDGRPVSLE
jgi:prepilin-type processing-associated H-X9-DG protein